MKLKNKNLKIKTKYNGFTLIETLVATLCWLRLSSGHLPLPQRAYFSNLAKSQITAFYLAQEPIEYIRNKRDNNTIAGGQMGRF